MISPSPFVRPRLAVLWRNFGPYHVARLRALSARFEATGIQIVGNTTKHGWNTDAGDTSIVTLFPDDNVARPLLVSRRLWAALDLIDPEVLLIPSYSPYPAWVCLAWGILHRRTRILMTESNAFDAPRSAPGEAIKRILLKFYHGAIVGGTTAAEYLVQLGFSGNRIHHGYDCVDVAAFERMAGSNREDEAAVRAGLNLPARYFVCPARFVPEKNHRRLLTAFRAFRDTAEGAGFHLLLCGNGPLEPEIRKQIEEEHIAGVELRGFLQMDGMAAIYAFACAMILPSTFEAWGLVVNEALACGSVVLVSDRAGSSYDLVDESTGRRFDPENGVEIQRCLAWAARLSPEERSTRAPALRRTAARFSPEYFADQVQAACRFPRPSSALDFYGGS